MVNHSYFDYLIIVFLNYSNILFIVYLKPVFTCIRLEWQYRLPFQFASIGLVLGQRFHLMFDKHIGNYRHSQRHLGAKFRLEHQLTDWEEELELLQQQR